MSNWIDEKAIDCEKAVEIKVLRETAITLSNYWALLLTQLNTDIEQINGKVVWKTQTSSPIRIGPTTHPEYDFIIEKPTFPAVSIYIKNGFNNIDVIFVQVPHSGAKEEANYETWEMVFDKYHTRVRRFKEEFLIPQQVSAKLLEPVIDAICDGLKG